jgi:hypothetical protein
MNQTSNLVKVFYVNGIEIVKNKTVITNNKEDIIF